MNNMDMTTSLTTSQAFGGSAPSMGYGGYSYGGLTDSSAFSFAR